MPPSAPSLHDDKPKAGALLAPVLALFLALATGSAAFAVSEHSLFAELLDALHGAANDAARQIAHYRFPITGDGNWGR